MSPKITYYFKCVNPAYCQPAVNDEPLVNRAEEEETDDEESDEEDSKEVVEDNPEYVVKNIVSDPGKYSKKRSETGCLEYIVAWEVSEPTVEPIWNLICSESQTVNAELVPILKYYMTVTDKYPNSRRQCWLCNTKCTKGSNLCTKHYTTHGWIFMSIKD